MRTIFLLIAFSIFSFSVIAQERFSSVVFNNMAQGEKESSSVSGRPVSKNSLVSRNSNRTTSGSIGSWYDYPDSILGITGTSGLSSLFMWPDTAAIFGYMTGSGAGYTEGTNYNVSIGTLFNPMDSVWVPYGSFIPPSSGFTIDSVTIIGIYGRPIGATYTDSLKLTFVYGNGDSATNLLLGYFDAPDVYMYYGAGLDTAYYFPMMYWDSVQNTATNAPGVSIAPITYTFPLGPADTSVASLFSRSYPVNIVVPDSNLAAMSLSFVSGATSFPAFPGTDTVVYADGTFKYGDFQPVIAARPNTTIWQYPAAIPVTDTIIRLTDDFPTGFFKHEGSSDWWWWPQYVSAPISLESTTAQYPYILFHAYGKVAEETPVIKNPVNKITAYPNPATEAVTIAFNLNAPASVTISLTNMMGQRVADVPPMENITNGKSVINTSALADGIYLYTVAVNGMPNTGQIVVSHR